MNDDPAAEGNRTPAPVETHGGELRHEAIEELRKALEEVPARIEEEDQVYGAELAVDALAATIDHYAEDLRLDLGEAASTDSLLDALVDDGLLDRAVIRNLEEFSNCWEDLEYEGGEFDLDTANEALGRVREGLEALVTRLAEGPR